jgi:hypothetical protein
MRSSDTQSAYIEPPGTTRLAPEPSVSTIQMPSVSMTVLLMTGAVGT